MCALRAVFNDVAALSAGMFTCTPLFSLAPAPQHRAISSLGSGISLIPSTSMRHRKPGQTQAMEANPKLALNNFPQGGSS